MNKFIVISIYSGIVFAGITLFIIIPILAAGQSGSTRFTTMIDVGTIRFSDDTTQITAAVNGGSIPVGTVIDYAGSTEPSGWLFAFGQAVSRTTYADLFSAIGTTYGIGDGSTTFNVPDLRGRIVAGQDNMGGTSANRLTNQSGGLDGDTLGTTGGAETHTLTEAQMPSHAHTGGMSASEAPSGDPGGSDHGPTTSTGSAGGGGAHNNVQPTIILNKIIKT